MEAADDRRADGTPNRDPEPGWRWKSGYFYSTAGLTAKVVGRIPILTIFNTHDTTPRSHIPEQTWFTFQMSRDAFPTRELSLSGSSRCSSQPPSTRRVGSGKLHSTHAWSSEWVGMGWRGRRDYSEAQGSAGKGPWAHHFVSRASCAVPTARASLTGPSKPLKSCGSCCEG